MQAEGGFEPLRIRANRLTHRLLYIVSSNSPLLRSHVKLLKQRKTKLKYPSTLCNILKITRKCNISEYSPTLESRPPWQLKSDNFLKNFHNLCKNNTNPIVFKFLFDELYNDYKKKGWEFLFTDGSKTTNHVGFAICNDFGITLKTGLLPQNATIFEAEAVAIIQSLELCQISTDKHIICTDSRSVFDAALNENNKNELIISIQQHVIKANKKVKLLWIPSHIGITGNETADLAAKAVYRQPTYLFIPKSKKFISRYASTNLNMSLERKWHKYNHPYKIINPTKQPLVLPPLSNCFENKCITRLRLTHTRLTHQYLINKTAQPICSFCGSSPLTVLHILADCPALLNLRVSICKSPTLVDLLKLI